MNDALSSTRLVELDPDAKNAFAELGRANPFFTFEFVRAMQALGREVWVFHSRPGMPQAEMALGFLKRGRLSAELEFISLPAIAARPQFWDTVTAFCRKAAVTDLVAGRSGSPEFELPRLIGEISRSRGYEFVLPLHGVDLPALLSSNHKRNVKKAQKAGISIRHGRNLEWLTHHAALIGHSAERRIARGESVSMHPDTAQHRAFLQNGSGKLFQATRDGEVLSSVLVLTSPCSAYYQSAGTSPDGMNAGASHFLIHSIATTLQAEGCLEFNLGGAPEGSSLARFKSGFGPRAVALCSAKCYIGPDWKRKLRSAIRLLRSDRQQLMRAVKGSSWRALVFGLDTHAGPATSEIVIPEARLEPLTEDQIANLPVSADDPEFRNRNLEQLVLFGKSYAFAVYVNDVVAHVSWVLPRQAVMLDPSPGRLELQDDEVEITGCETRSEFRGKGVYGYAIQQLAQLVRNQGIRRIYMKTAEDNNASQNGIRRAGLKPIGSIRVIRPPLRPSRVIVRRSVSWS